MSEATPSQQKTHYFFSPAARFQVSVIDKVDQANPKTWQKYIVKFVEHRFMTEDEHIVKLLRQSEEFGRMFHETVGHVPRIPVSSVLVSTQNAVPIDGDIIAAATARAIALAEKRAPDSEQQAVDQELTDLQFKRKAVQMTLPGDPIPSDSRPQTSKMTGTVIRAKGDGGSK